MLYKKIKVLIINTLEDKYIITIKVLIIKKSKDKRIIKYNFISVLGIKLYNIIYHTIIIQNIHLSNKSFV